MISNKFNIRPCFPYTYGDLVENDDTRFSHQVLLGPQEEMDAAAGGQDLSQVLTDFHRTQSGDGKTLPQCSGKASSHRGRVQV